MLKEKLKISEMASSVLPTRKAANSVSKGSESAFGSGFELELLNPHGFGLSDSRIDEDEPMEENWGSSRVLIEDSGSGFGFNLMIIDEIEKSSDLDYELTQNEINFEKLQRIASTGLPTGGSRRATTWKLLLGYLPPLKDAWQKVLSENRSKYAKLKDEFLLTPTQHSSSEEGSSSGDPDDGSLRREDVSNDDHPLCLGEASVWNKFFEYTQVAEQIDRDVERTHPDLRFFSGDSSLSTRNKESMRNILLLFAKLNPTTRYVQGMNEVLAPIYYVFCIDTDEENAANAEADSFACFVRLLSDSVDHFCQQLDDNRSVGIHSTISRLQQMLKANDEELWRHLELKSKVNLQFYAFRWITLLLTQEFPFNTVLRIWDSLLSSPSGVQDMLLRVCCAMLLCVKRRLLEGDFTANLYLLLHYPQVDIEHLLQVARDVVPDASSFRLSI
ncbi:hypothetical protein RND81_06G150000 [Saponaria officinalis]|uniref:Rab-GAP TBC domain-containing protein n=1 Tax=Saponaria officinalis TaxID=3572 RepID=A0AAW1K6J7_SAPOF